MNIQPFTKNPYDKELLVYKVRCTIIPGEPVNVVYVPYRMTWDAFTGVWHGGTSSTLANNEDKHVKQLSNQTILKPIKVFGHEINGYRVIPGTPIFAEKWCTEEELNDIEEKMLQEMVMEMYRLGRACKNEIGKLTTKIDEAQKERLKRDIEKQQKIEQQYRNIGKPNSGVNATAS